MASKLRVFALLAALLAAPAFAADTPASEQSIRELLTVMEAQKLVEDMSRQIDGMMKQMMDQAMQGRVPSPREQQVIDRTRERSTALLRQMLTWQRLEPIYLRIYRDSLTQEEVDGMLAFYRTPAGRALVRKMPLVVQNTMREMQAMIVPMMGELKTVQEDAIRELNAGRQRP